MWQLLADVGVEEMGFRRGVRAPTWCAIRPPHRSGVGLGAKGNGGNPVGSSHRQAEGTAGHQGGQARVGTVRKRAGGCDSQFHAKAAVSRDGDMDLADEAVRQDGDGEG